MNRIEILKDSAMMFFNYKGKEFITIIDLEDAEMLKELNVTWNGHTGNTSEVYVRGTFPKKDGKRKSVMLHRFLMNAPEGLIVDHVNRNPLDNRKSNLRIVTSSQSSQNKGSYSTNKSGIRGVYFCTTHKKWRAQVRFKGKTRGGYHDSIESAKEEVIQLRKQLFTHSEED
jgi:hypothetical protein